MDRNTDKYQITVAGDNPHEVAECMGRSDSPFHDSVGNPSVSQHIMKDNQIVGGIVDAWAPEHLTPEQERYLQNCPHVIDVRHVYPE